MRRKLIAGCLIIILFSSLITGFLSMGLIRQSLINSNAERLTSSGYLIQKILTDKNIKEVNYEEVVKGLHNDTNQRITFIDEKGNIIADSMDNNLHPNNILINDIESSIRGNKVVRITNDLKNNMTYVSVIMPAIKVEGELIILRLQSPIDYLQKLTQVLIRSIGIAIIIGIFTSLAIAYLYSRKILKPIGEITAVSKLIAKGKFHKRVIVNSGDEIEDMAETFNYMTETIENNINVLNDKNLKLNAIMIGMVDGIIAFDSNGTILLVNHFAREILSLNCDNLEGKNIYDLVYNPIILNLIDMALQGEVNKTKEMGFSCKQGFIYKVKASVFHYEGTPENKGIVLVFEDITEIKKSEDLKRDFIINASHELKTPLTTISGFIETLKLGNYKDEQQRQRFISIIESETNRLKRLTQSMLTLAVAESMHENEEGYVNVDVCHVIEELKDLLEYLSENKNITLLFEAPENMTIKVCNRDWFKQLLLNLIDNAIKYTSQGGNVQLNCFLEETEAVFIVQDDGIGISADELPRIFDKFYRVDKSRTSEIEGTGLGLAIVKHIVKALKGKIEVESEVGKGSKFTVYLPK